jgi:arabinogalactan oligomer/maltooligosaccharide transport system substrate-binding protein
MLKEMAASFVAAHPTYTVEVRVTGEDKAKDAAMADLDAAADVFAIAHDQLGALVEAGAVYPNTLYAEEIAKNDSAAALTAATYDGTVYGYPSSAETYYLYYNKSVFAETDVASLDKMLQVASAAGKTVGFDMGNNYFTASFWFANNCKLFGDSGSDVKGSTFNSAEGLAVAKYIATLKAAGLQNINDGDAEQAFANGTLAAQVTGSWKTDAYKTARRQLRVWRNFRPSRLTVRTSRWFPSPVQGLCCKVQHQISGSRHAARRVRNEPGESAQAFQRQISPSCQHGCCR